VQQLDLLVHGRRREEWRRVVDREDARLVLEHGEREQPREGPRARVLRPLAHREQVADDEPDNVEERHRREVLAGAAALVEAGLAELVVDVARLRVLEHLVRALVSDELFGRLGVVRVLVRVVLEGDGLVLLFYLCGAGIHAHAKDREEILRAAHYLCR